MQRKAWLRKINFLVYVIASMLFVWSCSEGPTPGPISPINPGSKRIALKSSSDQSSGSTVRPVNRLESSEVHALAKSGYNQAKVVEQLQDIRDELKAIVDKNPRTHVAYKLNDAVGELNRAISNMTSTSSYDRDGEKDDDDDKENGDAYALYKIRRAKAIVQDAVNRGLLLVPQGKQFMLQLAEIESQINAGYSPTGDYRGQSKSLWIKRSHGGLIKFGGHSIDVPKYATKQDAEFSISISPNDYIAVDFGPDGWFDQPVIVTISYKDADLTGIDPSKLTLAWFDESTGQWVDLGGVVDIVKKTVTAKSWHFTQYTIATK